MNNRPVQRLMFLGGLAVACAGVFFASRSAETLNDWRSIISILVIMAGATMAIVGLFLALDSSSDGGRELRARNSVLPSRLLPVAYGGFVLAATVVPGLVMGHYAGRSAGLQTGIFAFILVNAVFGLGLALSKKPNYS